MNKITKLEMSKYTIIKVKPTIVAINSLNERIRKEQNNPSFKLTLDNDGYYTAPICNILEEFALEIYRYGITNIFKGEWFIVDTERSSFANNVDIKMETFDIYELTDKWIDSNNKEHYIKTMSDNYLKNVLNTIKSSYDDYKEIVIYKNIVNELTRRYVDQLY